ncbi:MAG: ABC transporter ATP-binding protein/permease [Rhizobiaceae bacterium]|nr:ABC transporter ATP-binding protein/permease [Rhizobiaceae bacterium]
MGEIADLIARILRENGRDYRAQYILATILLIVIGATSGLFALIMRYVIDDIFYRQRGDLIALISGLVLCTFILRGVATYWQSLTMARIGNNLIARYQARIFDHLMRLGIDFFSDRRSGALAAQINENVTGIRDLVGLTLTSIARDAVSLVFLLGVMVWQDPLLSGMVLLIGPPLVIGVGYLGRRLRAVTRQSVEINSRLIGAMQEATQGIAVVKAFTMEDQLSTRLRKLVGQAEERSNKIASVTERLGPITETLAGFAISGVIAYAGYRAIAFQQPPGNIFSFITAFLLAYDPVRRLSRVHVGLERALVNARMIYEILDLEPRQRDEPGAVELAVGKGEVRFDNVTFAYGDNSPVLHGVSFIAEAGKTTAIVGASGAGKSTLVSLLERFYDVHDGAILIDGQDIARITKSSLRHSMAFVSQQPYLFEGTIRDNIRYGRPDATDAETEFAARKAAADGFIRQQPQGYETSVGENGATLSGGQRQRLSIARAIVRNAPILLLDEATSALDNESEALVQAALTEIMRDRTTIVIAHRLSTVINADKIIVLEQGRVVEQGTHRQLLADKNGIYARFYLLQTDKGGLGLEGETVTDAEPAPKVAKRRRAKA